MSLTDAEKNRLTRCFGLAKVEALKVHPSHKNKSLAETDGN